MEQNVAKGLGLKLSPGRAFRQEEMVSAKALRLQNVLGAVETSKEASVAGVG